MSSLLKTVYREAETREQMLRECDLVEQVMPRERFTHLLDLACGSGLNAIELARRGYTVTGIDINRRALDAARESAVEAGADANIELIESDTQDLRSLRSAFDGIVLFWRAFGFFSPVAQTGLFGDIRRLLVRGGVFLLDLNNRLFYMGGQIGGEMEDGPDPYQPHPALTESTDGGAFHPDLEPGFEYPFGHASVPTSVLLDPNLFTPGEISGIAASHGLRLVCACAEYSPDVPATPQHRRMQLVFERR